MLGDGIVEVNIAIVGQVVERTRFPVHQVTGFRRIDGGDRRPFCYARRAGDRTAPGTAAAAGAVIFGTVAVETNTAVQLKITGNLQGIKSVNAEGIGLAVGIRPIAVEAANMQAAVRVIEIDRRREMAFTP